MIVGLQCLDPRSVWLLMGHDGAFLEHSTCEGQSSGSSVWRGHLCKTHGEINVLYIDSLTGSQDYCYMYILLSLSSLQTHLHFTINFHISSVMEGVLM